MKKGTWGPDGRRLGDWSVLTDAQMQEYRNEVAFVRERVAELAQI